MALPNKILSGEEFEESVKEIERGDSIQNESQLTTISNFLDSLPSKNGIFVNGLIEEHILLDALRNTKETDNLEEPNKLDLQRKVYKYLCKKKGLQKSNDSFIKVGDSISATGLKTIELYKKANMPTEVMGKDPYLQICNEMEEELKLDTKPQEIEQSPKNTSLREKSIEYLLPKVDVALNHFRANKLAYRVICPSLLAAALIVPYSMSSISSNETAPLQQETTISKAVEEVVEKIPSKILLESQIHQGSLPSMYRINSKINFNQQVTRPSPEITPDVLSQYREFLSDLELGNIITSHKENYTPNTKTIEGKLHYGLDFLNKEGEISSQYYRFDGNNIIFRYDGVDVELTFDEVTKNLLSENKLTNPSSCTLVLGAKSVDKDKLDTLISTYCSNN